MNKINIITRCTRLNNIKNVMKTVFNTDKFEIIWHLIFDTSSIKFVDTDILKSLDRDGIKIYYLEGRSIDMGHELINTVLDSIEDGYVSIIDDDNAVHEDFYDVIWTYMEDTNKRGFIYNQWVGGKDFTGLDVRLASPENCKVQHIDMAQFCLRRDLISNYKIPKDLYWGDGLWIEQIYNENKDDFIFIDRVLSNYNYFSQKRGGYSLPRVLIIGSTQSNFESNYIADWESTKLNIMALENDNNLNKILQDFNPDSIVTIGDPINHQGLFGKAYDIRKRWIHFDHEIPDLGEFAWRAANHYILSAGYDDEQPLISYFTPIYNTGDRLWRTFESVRNSEYVNWEWVLVNDSNDGGKTLAIAKEIADMDSRVKVYDFGKKSGGIVGESKYRAASLSNGKYIMELDHDDYILPAAGRLMVEAFKKYPDAKFVYSDCVECTEDHVSMTYGDNFSFGYGSYREESWNGRIYKVINTSNINPKTIRHIVGVPNHFRAWDRAFYHQIGGHNRRLTIADDYELIVRTFLNTRMVKIPKLLYLQFYHSNNTQNETRADIQRRVRGIADFYNEKIKDRFLELGYKDWAWDFNPHYPLAAESRFGNEEGYVNYIWDIDEENKYQYDWNVLK